MRVLKLLYTRCIFRQFQAQFLEFFKFELKHAGADFLKNPIFGAISVQSGAIRPISVGFFGAIG